MSSGLFNLGSFVNRDSERLNKSAVESEVQEDINDRSESLVDISVSLGHTKKRPVQNSFIERIVERDLAEETSRKHSSSSGSAKKSYPLTSRSDLRD